MDALKRFLVQIAQDPSKLADYFSDPDAALQAAGIPDEDVRILRSKDQGALYHRLRQPREHT